MIQEEAEQARGRHRLVMRLAPLFITAYVFYYTLGNENKAWETENAQAVGDANVCCCYRCILGIPGIYYRYYRPSHKNRAP